MNPTVAVKPKQNGPSLSLSPSFHPAGFLPAEKESLLKFMPRTFLWCSCRASDLWPLTSEVIDLEFNVHRWRNSFFFFMVCQVLCVLSSCWVWHEVITSQVQRWRHSFFLLCSESSLHRHSWCTVTRLNFLADSYLFAWDSNDFVMPFSFFRKFN